MMAPPPGYRDWETLAATAARLLAKRERGDAESVAAGTMSAEHAMKRRNVVKALAEQWRYVVERIDAPEDGWAFFQTFGAYPITVRLELADIARNAAELLRAAPGHEGKAHLAGACAALYWWQLPMHGDRGDDIPQILRVHAANQQARAQRAARLPKQPVPLPPRPKHIGALL